MKNAFKTLLSGLLALILASGPIQAAEFNSGTYSETDASNTSPSPNGWPAGTYFNQVEPIGRATLGALQRWWDRANAQYTVGGTANAITLTPSNTSYPVSYVTGEVYCFKATAANTGATTENINSLGAKNVFKQGTSGPTALVGGEIQSGQLVCNAYDGTELQIESQIPNPPQGVTSFTGDGTILSNSGSTGAVTATLANASAQTVLGNATGSSGGPAYTNSPVVGGPSTAATFIPTSATPPSGGGIYSPNITTLGISGHIANAAGGTSAPTCSTGCASIGSGSLDTRGKFTVGTSQTSSTILFGTTWAAAPYCVANSTSGSSYIVTGSVTQTQASFNYNSALSGVTVTYICIQ